MAKPKYQAYEMSIASRSAREIELYLLMDMGKKLGEHSHTPFNGPNVLSRYYVVRGCTAIQITENNRRNSVLRLVGTKENIEEVLADIKEIAPKIKIEQVRTKF